MSQANNGRVDFATMQTAAGIPKISEMGTGYVFSRNEIGRLRKLAEQVAGIASEREQEEKAALWREHNDLKTRYPVVFIDPENGWNECLSADKLECEDPLARVWEMGLLKQIFWAREFRDDKVIEPYFDVPHVYSDDGWGLDLQHVGGEDGGSYKIIGALRDYGVDFPRLHCPRITIDEESSNRVMELAEDIFGGFLSVRRKTTWWWSFGLTYDYIMIRGFENFLVDLIDEPEWVAKTMALLCEGVIDKLDFLEKNGLMALNTDGTYVGSGGLGYTSQLPSFETRSEKITTKDMWGFVESQEMVSVSPEMYAEFLYPHHERIAGMFGLNCYGCCEPFNPRWKYIKNLPNLRRVSVSPWADMKTVPELLEDKYIASIKLTPAHLAMPVMDEKTVRSELRAALETTRGCVVELIMKDNNTLGNNPENGKNWVRIAREEISAIYG
ncbi:MAG: hypothetical protein LBQ36_09260 [Synergistaceae bacterium]|jgi:hypothetical protein|nr:hypothetical protein [Synergistaceae bacterium]